MLEWLVEEDHNILWGPMLCQAACVSRQLATLQWLRRHGCPGSVPTTLYRHLQPCCCPCEVTAGFILEFIDCLLQSCSFSSAHCVCPCCLSPSCPECLRDALLVPVDHQLASPQISVQSQRLSIPYLVGRVMASTSGSWCPKEVCRVAELSRLKMLIGPSN